MGEEGNATKAMVAVQPDKKAAARKQDDIVGMVLDEERNTGAIPFIVYRKYLKAAGGLIWAPVILLLLTFMQAANGETSLNFVSSAVMC